jgi:hypothetical protein
VGTLPRGRRSTDPTPPRPAEFRRAQLRTAGPDSPLPPAYTPSPPAYTPLYTAMPKSKREKVVALTKTGKKTRDDKSNLIEAVRVPSLSPSPCGPRARAELHLACLPSLACPLGRRRLARLTGVGRRRADAQRTTAED